MAKRFAKVRRFFATVFTVVVTIGIIGGAGAAVFFGQDALASRAEAKPDPAPAPLTSVSVRTLTAEPGYRQTRVFVGQIEPQKTVAASFELAGKLDRILVDEGDDIRAGQLIAEQDTELLAAERAALASTKAGVAAQLAFAKQRLERAEALEDRGFATQQRIDEVTATRDELAARIREIDANLRAIDIRIEKSKITAPFDGRVTQRFLDGGEALSPGQRVLELIETGAPLLRVGLPLSLNKEVLRDAQVTISGATYEASLVTLRPDIDPTTRTRTALFQVIDAPSLAFGQTAEVRVDTQVATPGTWVPIDSLTEGARGQWTLLVLNEADVVQRATAVIIHAESTRVFVQGSFPDGTRMIESGVGSVVPGQRVTTAPLAEG